MSVGAATQLAFGATSTVNQRIEFTSESITARESIIDTSGFRGVIDHPVERTRVAAKQAGGGISMVPSPAELDFILPKIFGAAKSGNNFPLSELPSEFFTAVDRGYKVFTYNGCVIDSANFSCGSSGPLQVSVNILAKDETIGNSGTFPTLSIDGGSPYIMSDSVFTLAGDEIPVANWNLSVSNGTEPQVFNSLTVQRFRKTDRQFQMQLTVPYEEGVDLLGAGSTTGITFSVVFTNGSKILTFSSGCFQFPLESPVTQSRGERFLNLSGLLKTTGSTAAITVSQVVS